MGELWLAERAGMQLAVKVLSQGRHSAEVANQTFTKELIAAAALSHPSLAQVYDFGRVSASESQASAGYFKADNLYLVMEFVDGISLASRVIYDWGFLQSVLLSLLDVLAFAHAKAVIHRDLKPANVLLPRSGKPLLKLTDFGLALVHPQRSGDPLSRGGTPFYMAPEQILGRSSSQGPWTDLYALGAMTYHLVTGQPLFGGKGTSRREIFEGHLKSSPPQLKARFELPAGFEGWLRRLLKKKPHRRFIFAADAAQALRELGTLDGEERKLTLFPANEFAEGYASTSAGAQWDEP